MTAKARRPDLLKSLALIREMAMRGCSDGAISARIGGTYEGAVQIFRARFGIPSGKSQRKAIPIEEREDDMRAPDKFEAELEWKRLLAGRRFDDPYPRERRTA